MQNKRYLSRNESFGLLLYDRMNGNLLIVENINDPATETIRFTLNGETTTVDPKQIHHFPTNPTRPHQLVGPTYVELYPTMFCNERCMFCYVGEELVNDPKKCMSREMVDKLAEELKKSGVFAITILGGEPLFYPDLEYLVRKLSQNGHQLYLSTNGTRQDTRLYDFLIENNVHINLSYHSHLPEIANTIVRTPNAFERLSKTMDYLLEKKAYFNVSLVINELNKDTITETVEYLGKKGVKSMSIYDVQNSGFARNHSNKDYFELYSNIIRQSREIAQKHGMHINTLSNFWFLVDGPAGLDKTELPHPNLMYGTIDGRRAAYINYDGNVYPVSYQFGDQRLALGNLRTHTLEELWNTPLFNAFRNAKSSPTCSQCQHFTYCRGGPITNYSIPLLSYPFYCPISKES